MVVQPDRRGLQLPRHARTVVAIGVTPMPQTVLAVVGKRDGLFAVLDREHRNHRPATRSRARPRGGTSVSTAGE